MKRKLMYGSSIWFRIMFTILLVFAVYLSLASITYYFLGNADSFVVGSWVYILYIFSSFNKIFNVITTALIGFILLFICIYFIIISKKITKLSKIENEIVIKNNNRFNFYIFSFFIFIALEATALTLAITQNIPQDVKIPFIIVISILILLSIIPFIFLITSKSRTKTKIMQSSLYLYTEELEPKEDEENKNTIMQKPNIKPKEEKFITSEKEKSLLDALIKLDVMKKNNSISAKEYTLLKQKMIKKYNDEK